MLSQVTFLFRIIFNLFRSRKNLLITISIQQKEIGILKRRACNKRLIIRRTNCIILIVLNRLGKIRDTISIVNPETLLFWRRELIKWFRTYKCAKRAGRQPVSKERKQLILNMRNENIYWGC